MNHATGCARALGLALYVAAGAVLNGGCSGAGGDLRAVGAVSSGSFFGLGGDPRLDTGTLLHVRLADPVSSGVAHLGDVWHGETNAPVVVDGDEVLATGTPVEGVVCGVIPPTISRRGGVALEVRKLLVPGHETLVIARAAHGATDDVAPGAVLAFAVSHEVAMH